MIKALDIKTLGILKSKVPELEALFDAITETLDAGDRVYICGCGATGRLSLHLEALWR